MGAEVRSVTVRLTMDVAQAIAANQAYGKSVTSTAATAEAATMRQSRAVDTLASKAGKLGLAAAVGLGAMAKAAMDWESEWTGVSKTVNGTSEQLQGLEGDLRELARTMPATHEEIAATAEAAGQLGVATDNVASFTKVMVEMGTATNLTADEAATSIAQFMNVMQTLPGQVDEIGNTIAALGNKGASTEADITHMAQRVAGAGKLIGASEADVLGLSAAMANLGIQSELGGGAVQRALTIIYTAVKSGGDALDGFAKLAGMSADEFATKWSTSPVDAFDELVHGMERVQKHGGNVVSTLADLGIKGTQNLQVLLRLAGSGDMLSRSLDQANAAWEKDNALTKEYEKRAATTASQVQIAWNQIKDSAISAGAAILPVIADITSGVASVTGSFEGLPGPVQDTATAMLAVTAVAAGGLWFGTKVVRGVIDTRTALGTLRPEIARVGSDLVARSGVRQFTSDLAIMASTSRTAGATTERELARTAAASQRVRSTLTTAGVRGGLALGGLVLATSGLADSMGLSNTASLALMGTIAGPWGAAIGGGIGLVKDFRAESKQASDVIDGFNDSLKQTDFTQVATSFDALQTKTAALNDDLSHLSGVGDFLGDSMAGWADALGTGLTDVNQASDESITKLTNLTGVLQGVARANGDFIAAADNGLQNLSYGNLDDLGRVAAKVQPILDDLGYSLEYLSSIKPGSPEAAKVVKEINDALDYAASDASKVDAIGSALDGLGNQMESTADKAKALGDALDALLSPNLDLSAATDEWTTALRHLTDDLDKNSRTIKGNSDAAIKNRAAIRDRVGQIKDLLVAEANAGASSGKLSKSLLTQRKALIDAGKAAGISRDDIKAYINMLGLTPSIVKTIIQVDDDQARNAISSVGAWLESLDGKVARTYIDVIQRGFTDKRHAFDATGSADGSTVRSDGRPYADRFLYALAPREEVVSNRHGQADRYRPVLKAINADMPRGVIRGMLADGGTAGWFPGLADGGTARSLDSQLAIAQLLQQIHDLNNQLAETVKKGDHKGEHQLTGINRRVAELQLETAERDLRRAKHADEREAAQAAREKAREQRKTRADLTDSMGGMFDSIFPQELSTSDQVAATIADFRKQWLAAGGEWTKELRAWAQQTRAAAAQYDANAAAIDAETQRRDALEQTLTEQQSQLEQLNSTMAAYHDAVAGNFLSDPFHDVTVDPSKGPNAVAIAAAKAQLAALQATKDASAATAAQASRVMQQIAALQDSTSTDLTGVDALRYNLTTDTQNAQDFTAALQTLASKGLDTTGDFGGLYQQLASSGDFVTAEQLAQLSADQIDEYEKLFKTREDAAATLAAQTTQAVYSAQEQQLEAQIAQTTRVIDTLTAAIEILNASQTLIGEQVREGAAEGAAELHPDLVALKASVDALPGNLQQLIRQKGGR